VVDLFVLTNIGSAVSLVAVSAFVAALGAVVLM
jgi:hypothetical protein